MAETLTAPLSDRFGGGQLIGNFTVGSKELMTYNKGYGPTVGTRISPLEHDSTGEDLTYPLWGQNVLDWRNPKKEHNNIPPSLNIYVRYLASENRSVERSLSSQTETYGELVSRI